MEVNSVLFSVETIVQTPVLSWSIIHSLLLMSIYLIYSIRSWVLRSLVSFTSLVISSDNVNRGLVLFLLLCLIYKPGHN